MPNCPYPEIPEIFKTECIGNSLSKINSNFDALRFYACENYSKLDGLQTDIDALRTNISDLSSAVIPGLAKAWVKFDGTKKENGDLETSPTLSNRYIYSAYNISQVYRFNRGEYQITFNTPFANTNYLLLGTSSQKQASTTLFTWLQPVQFTPEWAIVCVLGPNSTSSADAEHISIVVY